MMHPVLRLAALLSVAMAVLQERCASDRGQGTAEYALLLVGVGALAVFAFKWLSSSGLLEQLFSAVISKLIPG